MPSLRWFATEHQNEYRPGASFTVKSPRAPAATTPRPAMCFAPMRCTRRSCGSCPKFASSITAVPGVHAQARERERVLARHHLHARGGSRASARVEQRQAEQPGQDRELHLTSVGRLNFDACGRTRSASKREPLLEQRRIDAAEVARRLQVAVAVEAARQPRVLADLRAGGARPDQERRCRRRRGRCRPSRSPRRAGRTPSRRA